jgi:hypothetical protein
VIVTYRPDGQDEQRWEFDPGAVRAVQAEAIEKRAGQPWDQWRQDVMQGATRARRVLLWHLLKTEHPNLRFEDVDYAISELQVEFTRDELIELREAARTAPGITEEQREMALAALDQQIAAAETGASPGKARSKKSA